MGGGGVTEKTLIFSKETVNGVFTCKRKPGCCYAVAKMF